MTKSIQLAIFQAFIALWEIIFEKMVAIWNFVSEDEDILVYIYIINVSKPSLNLYDQIIIPINISENFQTWARDNQVNF